ncbi:MAG TPA: prolyl oligopeptidase family serine peptidase [Blastocatellia bacterium]|nr:prolyl oligopeptidase family serine peptidase [Blastocatellia bacterium]
MKRLLALSVCLALLCSLLYAQTAGPSNAPAAGKWQPDDIINAETAGQFDISPDGRQAVWVKTTSDREKDGRVSNLMLSSLTEKREIELTRGAEYNNTAPKWSPSGQWIAFISTRPVPKAKPADGGPRPQLWAFSIYGGEPLNLTSGERGVMAYEWLDDDTIIFTAQEEPTQYERQIKEKKDGSVVVEDEEKAPPVRLFKLQVKAKKITRLSDNADRIQSFALSRDGRYALTIHDRSLRYIYDQKIRPAVFLHTLADGSRKQLFADGKTVVSQVRAARDGDAFYLTTLYSTHPQYVNASVTRLHYYEPASDRLTEVPLDWDKGLASGIEATPDGFLALLANGVRHRFARYTRNGLAWQRAWIEGEHVSNTFGLKLSRDGRTLLYNYTTASTPEQWFRATVDGARLTEAAQFTNLNPHFSQRTKAKTEIVRWKGSLDEEVEGILYYPHNYEAGKKYPLMLSIHGGPHGADFDAWSDRWGYANNLICERGAFLLKPNYHGSSNYGLKWGESIGGGKYYDLEVPDIEKGVDYLIARGLVDPDRIGTMGWSNGAILSTALTVANPARYKVCSSGAGNVEWSSDWANAVFGASFDNYYFGKSTLEDPQLYFRKSPYYQMHKVRTPTIIYHGTIDTQVPTSQSWMHYRALQQLGNTEVRFILFPGEPHGLQKLTHQRRKIEEDMAWFDRHLFKTRTDDNDAFRKDSPLALALKMKGFSKAGTNYGVMEKGRLIPEVVKYGSLKVEIGRFEITRAQFAAFDPAYKFEPGTENYPANNISFERAKAYCEWLSRLTGQTYRLGEASELEAIYDAAGAGENTLDYWAGYAVNPDDAIRLQKKIAELGSGAPLLREVGSFKAAGADEPVFDLGGNVAEWAVAKDGSGIALGGSADQPVDGKRARKSPAPQYTGFRVVKGEAQKQKAEGGGR